MKPFIHHLSIYKQVVFSIFFLPISGLIYGQTVPQQTVAFEDYVSELVQSEDEYLSMVEEWRELIDHWLENPLHINSEEADLLFEARLVSRHQLNKLREYRLKYGDLLSVYELSFVDGWDSKTTLRVIHWYQSITGKSPL